MRKSLWKKILIYTLSICMVLGLTMAMGIQDTAASYVRYVTASSLNIRKTASGKAAVVGYYYKGDKVTCYGVVDGWTKVKYNGYYRYVS
ncbi:MAG: SH3 domain-containing protein, partial [Anaerostipes sp.]|nr:SH3 domain-containing protein [Anaerostipes sp.]